MNNITDYQQRLMQAFGFDVSDLHANRTGEMSNRQVRRLQPTTFFIVNGVVIIAVIAIFGLGLIFFLTNSMNTLCSTVFIFGLFGGVFVLWPWLNSQQEANVENNQPVTAVRGSLSLETGEAHATSRYYAVIEGIRFPVKEQQIRFLQEGDVYRIYYTPNEKTLLSLEWEQVQPLHLVQLEVVKAAVVAQHDPQVTFTVPNLRLMQPTPAVVKVADTRYDSQVTFSVPNPSMTLRGFVNRSAAAPSVAQQRSVQTLMATFSFDATDLALNHKHQISDRQVEKLTIEVQKWGKYTLIALVSTLLPLAVAPGMLYMNATKDSYSPYVFALVAFVVTVITGVKWLQLVLDRTDMYCNVVEGKITHRHEKYDDVIIGTVAFRVNTYEDYALSASESYRIFYTPRSRMILSAEALP